ncbi:MULTISPECIES: hypothetical protein [Pseudoalteromonas]|uniref:hypothetical protein n=1 Tax=Pseudoalteromonas TaxID=53246 RepID=UPI000B18EBBB|nr:MULTISPECIES: hypothetical protein [Pseudoalteromonas]
MQLKLKKSPVKNLSHKTLDTHNTQAIAGGNGPSASNPIVCHSYPVCWTKTYCWTA